MLLGGAPCSTSASSVAAAAAAFEVDECGNIARLRAAAGVEGLSDRPGVPLGLVVRDRDLNGTAAEEARLVREELVHGAAHCSAERVAGSVVVQRVVPAAARLGGACEEERGGAEAVVKLRTVTREWRTLGGTREVELREIVVASHDATFSLAKRESDTHVKN